MRAPHTTRFAAPVAYAGLLARTAAASFCGLVTAVLASAIVLDVAGIFGLISVDTAAAPGAPAELTGFGPVSLVIVAITGVSTLASVAAVVHLVHGLRANQAPGDRSSMTVWTRAWTTLPRQLVAVAVGAVIVLLVTALWPLATVAVLAARWRARRGARSPRPPWWLAVPVVATAGVLAFGLSWWIGVAGGTGLREATQPPRSAGLRVMARQFLVVLVSMVFVWFLGSLVILYAEGFAADPVGSIRVTSGLVLAMVLGLGLILGSGSLDASAPPPAPRKDGVPVAGAPHRYQRRDRGRRDQVMARLVVAGLIGQVAMTGTALAGGAAAANGSAVEQVVLVTDLSDSLTDDPCDGTDPCSIRGALARSTELLNGGALDVVVRFAVAGEVRLIDTLSLPAGVRLESGGLPVSLVGSDSFRILQTTSGPDVPEDAGVTIVGIRVTDGHAPESGAGLASSGIPVNLTEVTFERNTSGDGIGGAVSVTSAPLVIEDSTFRDNRAMAGFGGAVAADYLEWRNSTSVHDTGSGTAPDIGGAVSVGISGRITHGTFVGGGGVAGRQHPLLVQNSLIDVIGVTFPCYNLASASTGNLDTSGSCGGLTGTGSPRSELADHGGSTATVALLPGSPAIGAAVAEVCLSDDQRGRPRTSTACDIGAYQSNVDDRPDLGVMLEPNTTTGRIGSNTFQLEVEASQPLDGILSLVEGGELLAERAVTAPTGVVLLGAVLSHGDHRIRARFTPADPQYAAVDSDVIDYRVRAGVNLDVHVSSPAQLGAPVDLTASIEPEAASSASYGPGGTVTFRVGQDGNEEAFEATVSGLEATVHVPMLSSRRLRVDYGGDDYFAPTSSGTYEDITDTPAPTELDLSVDQQPRHGDPFVVAAVVKSTGDAAGAGLIPQGFVELFEGPRLRAGGRLVGGVVNLDVDPLDAPGVHQLRASFSPTPGWGETSGTLDVDVLRSLPDPRLTGPETSQRGTIFVVEAALDGRGATTVDLLDGDIVLTSQTLTLPTTSSFTVSGLRVGTHHLRLRVARSDDVEAADSPDLVHEVTVPDFQVTLGGPPTGEVGLPLRLSVTSSLDGDASVHDVAGRLLGSAQVVDGSASVVVVPIDAGEQVFTATVAAGPDVEPASGSLGVHIARTRAPEPEQVLTIDPEGDTGRLKVIFDTGDLPPPTGDVVLRAPLQSSSSFVLGSGALANGRVVIEFERAGRCFCAGSPDQLVLLLVGDDRWLPRDYEAVDIEIDAHPTRTTLAAPATVPFAGTAVVDVAVEALRGSSSPSGEVTVLLDGVVAGIAPVGPNGHAVLEIAIPPDREGEVIFKARFAPDIPDLTASATGPVRTTVGAPDAPRVIVEDPQLVLHAGDTPSLHVISVSGHDLLTVGDEVRLETPGGAVLGRGTWHYDGFNLVARVDTIALTKPLRAGTLAVVASYRYGPAGRSATSAPLVLDVATVAPQLRLSDNLASFTSAVVGRPVPLVADVRLAPTVTTEDFTATISKADGTVLDVRQLPAGTTSFSWSIAPAVTQLRTTYQLETTAAGPDVTPARVEFALEAQRAPITIDLGQLTGSPNHLPVRARVFSPKAVDDALPPIDGVLSFSPGGACQVLDGRTRGCELSGLQPGTTLIIANFAPSDPAAPIQQDASTLAIASISRQTPEFRAKVTPRTSKWTQGTAVTLTWELERPRLPGSVFLNIGGNRLCTAPAAAEECRFTVSGFGPLARQSTRTLNAYYVPDDQFDVNPVGFGLDDVPPVPQCIDLPTLRLTFDDPSYADFVTQRVDVSLDAEPCADHPGFKEGSVITSDLAAQVAALDPAGFRVRGWRATQPNYAPDGASTLTDVTKTLASTLQASGTLTAIIGFSRPCITVTVRDEWASLGKDTPAGYDAGTLRLDTPPDCQLPFGPSVEELRFRDRGVGLYRRGTAIRLVPAPRSGPISETTPVYELLDVHESQENDLVGTMLDLEEDGSVLLSGDRDRTVYPRFRVADASCSPIRLYRGSGGALISTGTERSSTVGYSFEAEDGTCDRDGSAGLLTGSQLKMRAVPANTANDPKYPGEQYFFSSWVDGDQLSDPTRRAELLAPMGRGVQPDESDYRPTDRTVTVPVVADNAYFGAQFGRISCRPVQVDLRYYSSSTPAPDLTLTPGNCPAREDSTSEKATSRISQGIAQTGFVSTTTPGKDVRLTRWYLPGTDVAITATPDRLGGQGLRFTTPTDLTSTTENGSLRFTMPPQGVAVVMDYAASGCRLPNVVSAPRTVEYATRSVVCPPGEVDPDEIDYLEALNVPTGWQAHWWLPRGGFYTLSGYTQGISTDSFVNPVTAKTNVFAYRKGGSYANGGGANPQVLLAHCAPVGVEVKVREGGRDLPLPKYAILEDSTDACVEGDFVQADRQGTLSLTPRAAREYTIASWLPESARSYDTRNYALPRPSTLILAPRCFTLNISNGMEALRSNSFFKSLADGHGATTYTKSNCPGAAPESRRYLEGTSVAFYFDNDGRDDEVSWSGADAAKGEVAAVVMSRDRTVGVSWHHHTPSFWSQVGSFFSGLAQVVVSALMSAVIGLISLPVVVLQGAILVAQGIGAILNVAGVDTSGLSRGLTVMQNTVDAFGSLEGCMATWATNGKGPALSSGLATADNGQSVGAELAGASLAAAGFDETSDRLGHVGTAYNIGNLVAGAAVGGSFTADPAESWSNISTVGSCLSGALESSADSSYTAITGREVVRP